MDGFRDRTGRGMSDRGSDRGSYDRYDRGSRRSSFSQPAAGISIDEVAQAIDDSNAKQLEVINDFFDDAKDDRYESEKQILAAIDDMIEALKEMGEQQAPISEQSAAPVAAGPSETEAATAESAEEILRVVNSNADLLAQFAEEQLPMLIRGNSSILNQIMESVGNQEEVLERVLEGVRSTQAQSNQQPVAYEQQSSSNEEVLNAANTNNALLNALRSDVAGISAELRSQAERISANADENNEPFDKEDPLTKRQADELYKAMEEELHAECVKVYKNVFEALKAQNETSGDEAKKAVAPVKIISIINLVLLIANLVFLVASVLGII